MCLWQLLEEGCSFHLCVCKEDGWGTLSACLVLSVGQWTPALYRGKVALLQQSGSWISAQLWPVTSCVVVGKCFLSLNLICKVKTLGYLILEDAFGPKVLWNQYPEKMLSSYFKIFSSYLGAQHFGQLFWDRGTNDLYAATELGPWCFGARLPKSPPLQFSFPWLWRDSQITEWKVGLRTWSLKVFFYMSFWLFSIHSFCYTHSFCFF